MQVSKSVEKLDKYFERLDSGKVEKIKPSHVEKVIDKLKLKKRLLKDERQEATKDAKKERLERKLKTVNEQIKRAEWLLDKIGS